MRLRAVEVRNWACIESLALTDLQDGVVVLHGPNRTGKSSLMQAIRSALFDHFHDSQEATLQAAIPLKSKEIPRVAIEFEHKGKRYRITKTFARTK
jgi:DNA repair exonuclease SbcCD ATPase subunit